MNALEWMAAATLAWTVLASIVALTWGVSQVAGRVERLMRADFEKFRKAIYEKVDAIEASIGDNELAMERRMGEVAGALRTKITEVELYMRDNFVRNKEMDALLKLINDRLDRIQSGLDRVVDKMFQGD